MYKHFKTSHTWNHSPIELWERERGRVCFKKRVKEKTAHNLFRVQSQLSVVHEKRVNVHAYRDAAQLLLISHLIVRCLQTCSLLDYFYRRSSFHGAGSSFFYTTGNNQSKLLIERRCVLSYYHVTFTTGVALRSSKLNTRLTGLTHFCLSLTDTVQLL